MIFSSSVFLFIYLPVVFFGYYIIPRKFALAFLFVMNLVFYGWGEPVYVLLMLASITVNYGAALLLARCGQKKPVFILTIVINLLIIGYFKYSGFIVSTVSGIAHYINGPAGGLAYAPGAVNAGSLSAGGLFGAMAGFSAPSLPIGISFYTFQAMSYIIDIYRGNISEERNALKFGAYISLFPQLNAGPIVRYNEISDQIGKREASLADAEAGLKKFICGLSKKLLLANPTGLAWEAFAASPGQNGVIGAWAGLLLYAFHIYFDFSGYSDMAVGLGRMLGFRFPENFNYPYTAKSITEFWRRWHMTLSGWFRDYVYIPLGGSRRGMARNLFNLAAVWFLTGLWHGASWNFAAWGMYFAILLVFERLFLLKLFDKLNLPAFVRRIYAFGFVVIGWGLFAITDLSLSFAYIAELIGISGISAGTPQYINNPGFRQMGNILVSQDSLRYIYAFLPTLLLCALAATPLPKRVLSAVTRGHSRFRIAEAVGAVVFLVLCVAAVTAGGYNPFIYFRF